MNSKSMRPSAVESQFHYSLKISYDAADNIEYIGKADIATATSESLWQIMKLNYDANQNITDIEWADGNEAYDNVWDDRESLSYS